MDGDANRDDADGDSADGDDEEGSMSDKRRKRETIALLEGLE